MNSLLKQSSADQHIVFLMVDSTDHITGKTGLTPTVTISKNAGAFASPAGAVTEIGSGWYKLAANATDSNTLGALIIHATGAAADPVDMVYEVVAFDPVTTSMGLNNIAATDVWSAGTRTLTAGTNIQLPSNGLANVTAWTVDITGNVSGNVSGSVGSITGITFPTNFDVLAISPVVGFVTANVDGWQGSALPALQSSFFADDSGETYASAVAGSVVKEIADNAAGTGLTAAQTRAALGMAAADLDTQLDAITAKTDLITTGGFAVVSPVNADGTSIEIYRGDDYLNADGRALSFTVSGIPSMVGGTVLLKIKGKDDISGTVVSATVCRFDMSRTISAELTGADTFDFEVEVTLASGSKCTPGVGTITAEGQL